MFSFSLAVVENGFGWMSRRRQSTAGLRDPFPGRTISFIFSPFLVYQLIGKIWVHFFQFPFAASVVESTYH
jgi:hypothetical protein